MRILGMIIGACLLISVAGCAYYAPGYGYPYERHHYHHPHYDWYR